MSQSAAHRNGLTTHVLTLVAGPGDDTLDSRPWPPNLARNGLTPANGHVLAPGRAIEWVLDLSSGQRLAQIRALVDEIRASSALDANLLANGRRRKRLLIADMESTIIEQEMLDELAGEIGLREKVADITERAMRGELDFEAAITERVALLAGLDAGVLDTLAFRAMTLMSGAGALVATMRANGAYCALVSGGFTCFTGHVADRLGFHEHRANTLEIVDGRLSGRVVPPILGRQAKLDALNRLCKTLRIAPDEAVAVGDGANDLAMLEAAGLGVAYRAKPNVRAATAAMPGGALVSHGDLTSLLYLQGYRQGEFVAGPTAFA